MLSGAIGARAIVRSTGLSTGAGRARPGSRFERTASATFRTAYPRDLAALGNRGYDMATLLLTFSAELVDPIANGVGRLFHLSLFHWHEKQTRLSGKLP